MGGIKEELRAANLINRDVKTSYCDLCLQQKDKTSCGAFLIENITCDLAGSWWPAPGSKDRKTGVVVPAQFDYAKTFRDKHAGILENLTRDKL